MMARLRSFAGYSLNRQQIFDTARIYNLENTCQGLWRQSKDREPAR